MISADFNYSAGLGFTAPQFTTPTSPSKYETYTCAGIKEKKRGQSTAATEGLEPTTTLKLLSHLLPPDGGFAPALAQQADSLTKRAVVVENRPS